MEGANWALVFLLEIVGKCSNLDRKPLGSGLAAVWGQWRDCGRSLRMRKRSIAERDIAAHGRSDAQRTGTCRRALC